MKTKIILLTLTLFFLSHISFAQMPEVPAQVKKFYDYVGKFEGDGWQKMGDKTETGKVTNTWSKIADGWGLLIDENIDVPVPGYVYKAHNILGYDIGTSTYHIYTIDNFADVHDHKGTVKDDNTIMFRHEGIVDGKPFVEVFTINFKNKDEYSYEGTQTLGGELYASFGTSLKRVK